MIAKNLLKAVIVRLTFAASVVCVAEPSAPTAAHVSLSIPRLERPAIIDGDLSDWRDVAWNDGLWDIRRVQRSAWYDGGRMNRLTDHGDEPRAEEDLSARYFMAWDDRYLYLGAEVHDNVNDVIDPKHEPKRWYYKDAIAWFIEAPRDTLAEKFGDGDHGFAFVIDRTKPEYGAWWRHRTATKTYMEEPLPSSAGAYEIRMNPWGRSPGDFILEARIDLAATPGTLHGPWSRQKEGDSYGICIVHTDPDGGDYGGHLLMYGTGDDDSTWARAVLTGPLQPLERRSK